jgi:hypothetical protein
MSSEILSIKDEFQQLMFRLNECSSYSFPLQVPSLSSPLEMSLHRLLRNKVPRIETTTAA